MVASHFGGGGTPNGWMSRSAFAWFSVVPLSAVVLVTFIVPLLVAKLPTSLVNFPNKEYWLAPERRAETMRRLGGRMEWYGVVLLAFLAFVYELVFEANLTRSGLANGPFIVALVAYLMFSLAWVVALIRAFSLPDNARTG